MPRNRRGKDVDRLDVDWALAAMRHAHPHPAASLLLLPTPDKTETPEMACDVRFTELYDLDPLANAIANG
jgi:hypothetical protein